MHARRVQVAKERLVRRDLLAHPFDRVIADRLVDGLHVVLDALRRMRRRGPSSTMRCLPTRPQRGSSVGSSLVRRRTVEQTARPDRRQKILRVVRMKRILHRVQVVEVAPELVEAVHRGQVLVAIAEVVLAELPRGVTLGLERRGDRRRLGRHADLGPSLPHRGEARSDRELPRDEVGSPRRATRLGVVVREHHALGRESIEVRRAAREDAAVIRAEVRPADVVRHDEEDVRLLTVRFLVVCHLCVSLS